MTGAAVVVGGWLTLAVGFVLGAWWAGRAVAVLARQLETAIAERDEWRRIAAQPPIVDVGSIAEVNQLERMFNEPQPDDRRRR